MPDQCPICNCRQVVILTPTKRRCANNPNHEWYRVDDHGNTCESPREVAVVPSVWEVPQS